MKVKENDFSILCVDEEKFVLEMYFDMLDHLGHKTDVISSPKDAIKYVEKNSQKIKMILCDYKMQEMNGIEFGKEITSRFPDIPFVIVSSPDFSKDELDGMEDKIQRFIKKPFSKAQLKDAIGSYSSDRVEALKEMEDLVVEFIEESMPLVEDLEESILALEENPNNEVEIMKSMRILHT